MTATTALCWINGQILPAADACIPVLDHGVLYGDGVFEGIRYYRRRLFKLAEHLHRLEQSARALLLTLPYPIATLAHAAEQLVAASCEENGYLRLVITRGVGPLGLDPTPCNSPNAFIIASGLRLVSDTARQQGAKVIIAATRRLSADGLDPRIKSLNYLNHILARIEANHAGADEAILLNAAGRVAEGTADNVFVVRNGRVITPPVTEGALAGITRAAVLELARTSHISSSEEPLAPYDLFTADECFLTGTGAELIPVASVDGRALRQCPGPVFRALQSQYQQLVLGEPTP